ncbi:hypothetical protein LZL87_001238 [Fusarium oxysporum]|nr:hypothetical protein LZL87_001238 [Fusarium oxysporum]
MPRRREHWTVTATLDELDCLELTIRPASENDPPPVDWRDLESRNQLRLGISFRITVDNAMVEMHDLQQFVFPGQLVVVEVDSTPSSDVRTVVWVTGSRRRSPGPVE